MLQHNTTQQNTTANNIITLQKNIIHYKLAQQDTKQYYNIT